MKKRLIQFHFSLLAFLVVHFLVAQVSGFGLTQTILFLLKIILCITGFFLFIACFRPFGKRTIYFSYYFLTPIITLLGYLFGGVFLVGILMSVLLAPIIPKQVVYEKNEIVVYTKFQGVLSACCTYVMYQKKYGVFELYRGEIQSDDNGFTTFGTLNQQQVEKLNKQLENKQ